MFAMHLNVSSCTSPFLSLWQTTFAQGSPPGSPWWYVFNILCKKQKVSFSLHLFWDPSLRLSPRPRLREFAANEVSDPQHLAFVDGKRRTVKFLWGELSTCFAWHWFARMLLQIQSGSAHLAIVNLFTSGKKNTPPRRGRKKLLDLAGKHSCHVECFEKPPPY